MQDNEIYFWKKSCISFLENEFWLCCEFFFSIYKTENNFFGFIFLVISLPYSKLWVIINRANSLPWCYLLGFVPNFLSGIHHESCKKFVVCTKAHIEPSGVWNRNLLILLWHLQYWIYFLSTEKYFSVFTFLDNNKSVFKNVFIKVLENSININCHCSPEIIYQSPEIIYQSVNETQVNISPSKKQVLYLILTGKKS